MDFLFCHKISVLSLSEGNNLTLDAWNYMSNSICFPICMCIYVYVYAENYIYYIHAGNNVYIPHNKSIS